MRGLSLVAASGGHSSSRCAGLSLSRPLLLRSTGSRCAGSVVVAHGPSCSAVCGIFPDQGSNPCPLHWQADSQPLRHQGSPRCFLVLSQCWISHGAGRKWHWLYKTVSFWGKLFRAQKNWPEPEDGRVDLHHLSTKKRGEKHCESICVNTQTCFS